MIEVRAPAVVKLLGEHAVVYGKLGIAAAIDMHARTRISESGGSGLSIYLKDIGASGTFSEERLNQIYKGYRSESVERFCSSNESIGSNMLPYLTIASRICVEYRKSLDEISVDVSSEIPLRRGFASSGACSTSFAVALISYLNLDLKDTDIIDIARDGDRVIHMNPNAGTLDINTSYYGGFVSYNSGTGARSEDIGTPIRFVLIDTGPKKSTAETVGHIASLYKADREGTERLLDRIDRCCAEGLRCLKSGDIDSLGRNMFEDHQILRELGVSSDSLDRAVDICMSNGALGAKLSGGGGGGVAIALTREPERLIGPLEREGFKVTERVVAGIGAKGSIEKVI